MSTSTDTTLPSGSSVFNLPLDETEPPPEHREELRRLKQSLARGEVPNCYYDKLEDYLSAEEKKKIALYGAIQTGLEESSAVFSPKRYRADYFKEKLLAETTLWFRILWAESVSAEQVKSAFQSHLKSGRRFPVPADVLTLAKGE